MADPPSVREFASIEDARAVAHAEMFWIWKDGGAPLRFTSTDFRDTRDDAILQRLGDATSSARLTIVRDTVMKPEPLTLLAAPVQMWEEIPEDFLPRQPIGPKDSNVLVTTRPGQHWRVRAFGTASGTWWNDIESNTTSSIAVTAVEGVDVVVATPSHAAIGGALLSIGDAPRGIVAPRRLAILLASRRGLLHITGVPDVAPLSFMVSHPKYVPYVVTATIRSLPSIVVLQPGSEIHGLVVDERHHGIEGAIVHLESVISASAAVLLSKDARTDSTGAFVFSQLPRRPVVLLTRKKGFAMERREVEIHDSVVMRLKPVVLHVGRVVTVHVASEKNVPIESVRLTTVEIGSEATTDRHGVAELSDLSRGRVAIRARRKGFVEATAIVNENDSELFMRISPAFVVHGRFAASGEMLRVKKVDGSVESLETLPRDGTFEMDLVPHHPVNLVFLSEADELLDVPVAEGESGEERDLGVLHPRAGAFVNGRVVRAGSGNALAGARVWALRHSASGPLAAWATGNIAECRTGADGSFHLRGLPEGPVMLRVEYPGLARANVATVTGSSDDTVVELSEGATVFLTALNPALTGLAHLEAGGNQLEFDRLSAPLVDGKALFRNVPTGPVRLSVVQGMRSVCVQEFEVSDGEQREVPCSDHPVKVRGVVTFGDAAAHGGTLYWQPHEGLPTQAVIITHRSASGAEQQQIYGGDRAPIPVATSEDGTFETIDLSHGVYDVVWMSAEATLSRHISVTVADGDESFVALAFPGATLRGQVVDEAGNATKGARVREVDGHATALTDSAGRFEIPGLPLGIARVQAARDSLTSAVTAVTIEDGHETEVTLRLESRDLRRIAVRAIRRDGSPAASTLVIVDTGSGGSDVLTADADGVAAVSFPEGLPPRIRFAAWIDEAWSLGDWTSGTAAHENGVVVRAGPDAATLTIASKSPAFPIIESASGWTLSRLMSLLGVRIASAPGAPAVVAGLPPGPYTVTVKGEARRIEVAAGGADLTFP